MKSGYPTPTPLRPISNESITLDAVDSATGLKVGRLKAEVEKQRYDFAGRRYMCMGILMASVLYRERLSALEVRIAQWMPSVMDYKTNAVTLSLAAVRKEFPTVDKSSLSKALKRLTEVWLLRREDRFSHFTVSPEYAWMWSAKEHRRAVGEWRVWRAEEERKRWTGTGAGAGAGAGPVVVEWPEDVARSA
jgi:hypothetical protein